MKRKEYAIKWFRILVTSVRSSLHNHSPLLIHNSRNNYHVKSHSKRPQTSLLYMHLDDDDYEVSKAWRLFWSWEMFWSVAPYFISWIWLILSYPLILCTGCLWFKPKKRAISHHCWSIGRRGWTCTGSSWPCPRSGCWGWRAGWQWAPATRWSLPGSPPSSLEVAFSNLKPPAFESVKVWDHCWLHVFAFTFIQIWEFKGHSLALNYC